MEKQMMICAAAGDCTSKNFSHCTPHHHKSGCSDPCVVGSVGHDDRCVPVTTNQGGTMQNVINAAKPDTSAPFPKLMTHRYMGSVFLCQGPREGTLVANGPGFGGERKVGDHRTDWCDLVDFHGTVTVGCGCHYPTND